MELGCDQFQGYLCGHPQTLENFSALLADPRVPCTAAEPINLAEWSTTHEHGAVGADQRPLLQFR